MGSCSSGGKGKASGGGAISTGTSDLNYTKVGKSFEKLPKVYQDSINDGLKMSTEMQNDIANGRRYGITDEWTTGMPRNKIKVITDVIDGKAVYTVKQRNKILKKNVTKVQCANVIAGFYSKILKGK